MGPLQALVHPRVLVCEAGLQGIPGLPRKVPDDGAAFVGVHVLHQCLKGYESDHGRALALPHIEGLVTGGGLPRRRCQQF